MTQGHRLVARDFGETLAGSWPIVSAGALLALPMLAVVVIELLVHH